MGKVYVSDIPELMKQWDPNNTLIPSEVSLGSSKKAKWICNIEHTWETTISSRIKKDKSLTQCPYCSNRKVLKGFNDFKSQYPEIAKDWSFENEKNPDEFTFGSKYTAIWKCPEKHIEENLISERIKKGGCSYCKGTKPIKGKNDLASTHPELVKEWHPSNSKKPSEFSSGSGQKVKWLCKEGHEWEIQIKVRAKEGNGCPFCSGKKVLKGFNDLARTHPELVKEWHPDNKLKPTEVSKGSQKKVKWVCTKEHEWEAIIGSRTYYNHKCPKCPNFYVKNNNHLLKSHPHLEKEWHPDNPYPISNFGANSLTIQFWTCSKNHKYRMAIKSKAKSPIGCQVCNNKITLVGFNDLKTTHPKIALEWHPDNDKNLEDTRKNSSYEAKWLCKEGHVWNSKVNTRVKKKTECPICNKTIRKIIAGINDLETTHPALFKEWDFDKNKLSPYEINANYREKVWWKKWHEECRMFHEWEATPRERIRDNDKTFFNNIGILVGCNDLATTHPKLVEEWHPRNTKQPHEFKRTSREKVWWCKWHDECDMYHEWEANIYFRSRGNSKDPIGSNQIVLAGCNDLATTHPSVADRWDYDKNDKSPTEVTKGSNYVAHWKEWHDGCGNHHEWSCSVKDETSAVINPKFLGRLYVGCNDLASRFPDIASLWHPIKNNRFQPQNYTAISAQEAWWMCKNGHEWKAPILHLTSNNVGCQECSKHGISLEEQEVADFIKALGFDIEQNTRNVITPKELDIYLHSEKIAVEFNGVYWHSELYRDKNYHQEKYLLCRDAGATLFQVWQDDWRYKQPQVESMLRALLFPDDSGKIVEIETDIAAEFISTNHVSGSAGSYSLGLMHNNTLVGVVSGDSEAISGWGGNGVSRLVEAFRERYRAAVWVLDLCVDSVYVLGMSNMRMSEPGYKYVDKDKRVDYNTSVKIFDAGKVGM